MNLKIDKNLNVARTILAIYVVLHHVIRDVPMFGLFFAFGQEAVMAFFILSGRVISVSENNKRKKVKEFYIGRIKRIYPPLLLTLSISFLMYKMELITVKSELDEFLATIFSLQDISALKPGVIANPFLGNSPLWSLSYEIYFYAIFPIARHIYEKNLFIARYVVFILSTTGLISYLLFPNHLSIVNIYLLSWWIGYCSNKQNNVIQISSRTLWVNLLTIISILSIYMATTESYSVGFFPGLLLRHQVCVAIVFAVLLSATAKTYLIRLLVRASFLNSMSKYAYGLYIVHYPILILWESTGTIQILMKSFLCFFAAVSVESKRLNPFYVLVFNKL